MGQRFYAFDEVGQLEISPVFNANLRWQLTELACNLRVDIVVLLERSIDDGNPLRAGVKFQCEVGGVEEMIARRDLRMFASDANVRGRVTTARMGALGNSSWRCSSA